jgi:hypothetical protein
MDRDMEKISRKDDDIETGEPVPENPQSFEDLSYEIMERSTQEVELFGAETGEEISSLEVRAKDEGLNIKSEHADELVAINEEVDLAKKELHSELVNESIESARAEFQAKVDSFLEELDAHPINSEMRNALLSNLFEPYIKGERKISDIMEDKEMAFVALRAMRNYIFSEEEDGKEKTVSCDTCGVALYKKAKFCHQCGKEVKKLSGELVMSEILSSLDSIGEKIKKGDLLEDENDENTQKARKFRDNAFFVISSALNSRYAEDADKADVFLRENLEYLEKSRILHETQDERGYVVDHVCEYTFSRILINTKDEELFKSIFEMSFGDPSKMEISLDIDKLMDDAVLSGNEKNKNEILKLWCETIGLDSKIVSRWSKSKSFHGVDESGNRIYKESFSRNIAAVKALEAERKGASQELFKKFGIANFDRYPVHVLINQLEKEDADIPYGVLVYPEADYNGAFFQDKNNFDKISSQLEKGGYGLRIIETSSQLGMARRLASLDKKHSPAGHKISFLMIGGHGTQSSVQLGNLEHSDINPPPLKTDEVSEDEHKVLFEKWKRETKRSLNDFKRTSMITGDLDDGGGEGIRRAAEKWLDEDASIVFISCSTGAEGGIAQKIGKELQKDTVGPDRPTNINSIDVEFNDEGKPVFGVKYSNIEEYGQAETVKYITREKK